MSNGIVDLRERFGGLPSAVEASGIWGDIWYQEAHGSTAIEGNTLVLKEVQALLSEGRAVGNKPLAQYLEVQGYAAASTDSPEGELEHLGVHFSEKRSKEHPARDVERLSA